MTLPRLRREVLLKVPVLRLTNQAATVRSWLIMKYMWFIVILVLGLVALSGCDPANPYRKQPRNCGTMNGEAVICGPPVNIKNLINHPTDYVEMWLGRPDGRFLFIKEKQMNRIFYNDDFRSYGGGGLYVIYNKNQVAVASLIYPDDLEFDETSILEFLSAGNSSVEPLEGTWQGMESLTWDSDPEYFTISAFSDINQPGKVKFIVLSPYERNKHGYYVRSLSGLTVEWQSMTALLIYIALFLSIFTVLAYPRSPDAVSALLTPYARPIIFHLPWAIIIFLFTGDTEEIALYGEKELWLKILGLFLGSFVIYLVMMVIFEFLSDI